MRTIDADALLQTVSIKSVFGNDVNVMKCGELRKILEMIKDAPTIEPQKTRGHWIDVDDSYNRISGICSACGWQSHMYEDDVVGMNFCPNCGADMREE